jgi:molybdopterin molybdotransferase
MISFKEAQNIVSEHTPPRMPAEKIPLTEALGRVLAEDIAAGFDIPPYDNSAMDGYAVCADDTSGATSDHPVTLKVIGETAAGGKLGATVAPGSCVRIMTGGCIPPGADAIVRVEETEEIVGSRQSAVDGHEEESLVEIKQEVTQNRDIRKKGEDIRCGETVIKHGERIRPAHIGLLASLGKAEAPVVQKPKVGILATGDELLDITAPYNTEKIYSSNNYALMAQTCDAGAEPVLLGIAGDEQNILKEKIENGLNCDILVTTGGVSAGKYDIVQDIFCQAGVRILFNKVAIRPGMPTVFGIAENKPVYGLPGNPVSAMVTYELFVRPVILSMLGAASPDREETTAILTEGIKKRAGRFHFLRGVTSFEGKTRRVTTTGNQGSGILSSMGRANCLILLPDGSKEAGDEVRIMLI